MARESRLLSHAAVVLTILGAGLFSAPAQDVLHVTAVSGTGAAVVQDAQGSSAPLGARDSDTRLIEAGTVSVASGQQLMLLSESGVVLIALGPARLVCGPAGVQMRVVLEDGRLAVAAGWPREGAPPPTVSIPADGEGVATVEAVVSPGRAFFRRSADTVQVGFLADGDLVTSMALLVRGKPRAIASGQLLTIEGPEPRSEPAAAWLASQHFDLPWAVNLGVVSAQGARGRIEDDLFENVIKWDVFGGQEYVTARLEARRFRPEIRQVTTTVTTPQRPVSAVGSVPETSGFPAANEVPLLSPAALSVANPTEGVTVIRLNTQARGLLTQTGSRGLGFRGLAQLAIPGSFGSGTPTIGPAGLGGQR